MSDHIIWKNHNSFKCPICNEVFEFNGWEHFKKDDQHILLERKIQKLSIDYLIGTNMKIVDIANKVGQELNFYVPPSLIYSIENKICPDRWLIAQAARTNESVKEYYKQPELHCIPTPMFTGSPPAPV